MELKNLATKDNADNGIWFQAVLYGEKQPFEIKILGNDADAVSKFTKDRLRKVKIKQDNTIDGAMIDELIEGEEAGVLVRIAGLRSTDGEPLTLNGEELKDDVESYKKLIRAIPAVKEFVLEISRERANFLSQKKEG